MSIGKPPYRRGSKETKGIKVSMLGGQPSLQVNYGGAVYGIPLSLYSSSSDIYDRNREQFSSIHVRGHASFGTGVRVGPDSTSKSALRVSSDGSLSIGVKGASTPNFSVSSAGVVSISGALTSTSGTVGGWSIDSNSIFCGDKDTSGYTSGAGHMTIASTGAIHAANFYINSSGAVYVKGTIAVGSTFAGVTWDGVDIDTAQIADDAIEAAQIGAGAVVTAGLAADAVTAAIIADDAVGTAALATDAVTAAIIADDAVVTAAIADNAVTNALIATDAVNTDSIVASAITASELATNAVTAVKITAGSITTAKVATGAITADEIGANAVTAGKIIADAVTSAKISTGAVIADSIGTNAVTAAKINANAVTAGKIEAGAVIAAKIATDAVTAGKIEASAVTAVKIATDAVTADKIEAGAITTAKLDANAVTINELATIANIDLSGKITLTGAASGNNVCVGINNSDAGGDNVAIGVNAGQNYNTTKQTKYNVAVGRNALNKVGEVGVDGQLNSLYNVGIGYYAGAAITGDSGSLGQGGNNTCVGGRAGDLITDGNYNTFIGASTDADSATASNRMALGYGAISTLDNTVVIGNDDVGQIWCSSDKGASLYCGLVYCTQIDTGNGLTEIYDMNQPVASNDAVTFATVNTGQGANELYEMNQPVKTTNSVTFSALEVTNDITLNDESWIGIGSSAERITFDTAGSIEIDGASFGINCDPAYKFEVTHNAVSSYVAKITSTDTTDQGGGLYITAGDGTATSSPHPFIVNTQNGGTNLFKVQSDGTCKMDSTTVTSDERIKTDIINLPDSCGLSAINQIKPMQFKTINNRPTDDKYGVIAQELELILPNLVDTAGVDRVDGHATPKDANGEYIDNLKSVNYIGLIAPLIKAVQELSAKVTALEAQIN